MIVHDDAGVDAWQLPRRIHVVYQSYRALSIHPEPHGAWILAAAIDIDIDIDSLNLLVEEK